MHHQGNWFLHQWYKNGNAISGATGSIYNATSGVVIRYSFLHHGSGTSPAAVLTGEHCNCFCESCRYINSMCRYSLHLPPIVVPVTLIAGFRNNVLRPEISQIINVTSAGQYKVEVSINGSCAVTSNIAVLDVINNPAPVITPASATM